MTSPLPSAEELAEILEYRDGELFWKSGFRAGSKAGCTDPQGYVRIRWRKQGGSKLVHRLIWKMHYGVEPPSVIDHVDGNPSNNRISNLRAADKKLNGANSKARTDRLQGARQAPSGRFKATCTADGKSVYLGTFATEIEAHTAYVEFKRKRFGVTNFR